MAAVLRETSAGEWIDGQGMPWAAWAYRHLTDEERATLGAPQPGSRQ
ncbi:hypothetical protein [Nocardia sp. SYP-A9097]|nr:hypothetical protein [Nocardia sp. SYP-A9097]